MQKNNGPKESKPTRRELLEQWKQNRAKVETPKRATGNPPKAPKFEDSLRKNETLPGKSNNMQPARDPIYNGKIPLSSSSVRKFSSTTDLGWNDSKGSNLTVMTPRRLQSVTPGRLDQGKMSVDRGRSMQRRPSQDIKPFNTPSKSLFQSMTPMKFKEPFRSNNVSGKNSVIKVNNRLPQANKTPVKRAYINHPQDTIKVEILSGKMETDLLNSADVSRQESKTTCYSTIVSDSQSPKNEVQDSAPIVEKSSNDHMEMIEAPPQQNKQNEELDNIMDAFEEETIKEEDLIASLFTTEEIKVINLEEAREKEDAIKIEEQETHAESQNAENAVLNEEKMIEEKVEEATIPLAEPIQIETVEEEEEKNTEEMPIKEEEKLMTEECLTENIAVESPIPEQIEQKVSPIPEQIEQKVSTSKKRKSEEYENGSTNSILEERGKLKKVLFGVKFQENAFVIPVPEERIKVEFKPPARKASMSKDFLEISKKQHEQQVQQIEDYGSELIFSVVQCKKGKIEPEQVITPVRRSRRLSTVTKSPPHISSFIPKENSTKKPPRTGKASSKKLTEDLFYPSKKETSKSKERAKDRKSTPHKKSGKRN